MFGHHFPSHLSSASPYTILNMPTNASADKIKKAYHDLAREYHPDKNGNQQEEGAQPLRSKFLPK